MTRHRLSRRAVASAAALLALLPATSMAQSPAAAPATPGAAELADAQALGAAVAAMTQRALPALPPGNLCCSPASLALAMAMVYGGARGETAVQMATAMAPAGWEQERILAAAGTLQQRLRGATKGFTLSTAQDVWPRHDIALTPEFAECLQRHFEAKVQPLDYDGDVGKAMATINAHIATVTQDRIKDLLHPGDITSGTRMVLTNALYLKADWARPFQAKLTREAPFHVDAKTVVTVPTMHARGPHLGAANPAAGVAEAVRLPYVGGDFALDLALPSEAGSVDGALAALLGPELPAAMKTESIDLAVPRFGANSRFECNDALRAAGIELAFTPTADFTGIAGLTEPLHIDKVLQQTWIQVDEKGTEAAAATAVAMRGAPPQDGRKVEFDRPFAYALRDLKTGLVLFLGRCTDPGRAQ